MQLYNTDFLSPSTPSVLLQHTSCPLIPQFITRRVVNCRTCELLASNYSNYRGWLLPRNPIEFVYPHGFMLRKVNNSGDISRHKSRVFVSEVVRFEVLGFEQVDEDFYRVYFREIEIGEFDAEALRFRPVQVVR
jgi:hypothetical protein